MSIRRLCVPDHPQLPFVLVDWVPSLRRPSRRDAARPLPLDDTIEDYC